RGISAGTWWRGWGWWSRAPAGRRSTSRRARARRGTAGSASRAWCSELAQHHERVLVVVLVVARADVDAAEAGALVERDRGRVAAPDLERGARAAERAALIEGVGEQAAGDAGAAVIGVGGDRVEVELVEDDPVVAEADDGGAALDDEARLGAGELGLERLARPRGGE